MSPALISTILGFILFVGVLTMVRRGKMHGFYAFWWLTLGIAALFLGLFPKSIDYVGTWFGIQYPPILVIIVACIVLTLKMLLMDIDATKQERKLRRLMQKQAILELEMKQLKHRARDILADSEASSNQEDQPKNLS